VNGVPTASKVILVILIALSCVPLNTYAICLSCWSLHGVTIQLRNGQTLEGYVTWNQYRVENETQTPFPDVLLEPLKTVQSVEFYDQLHSVTYPVQGLIVSAKSPRVIELDSLKSVSLRPHSLDKRSGAGRIPVAPARIIELLKLEPPVAYCHGDGELSTVYWLSYNPSLGEKELSFLCRDPWVQLIQGSKLLEDNNIVRLEFAYD